jgi:hypothetical protein
MEQSPPRDDDAARIRDGSSAASVPMKLCND